MAWNSLPDFIRDPTSSTDCLGVYFKRTCSRVTSASSALGILNDYALYKSTHALTHSLTHVQYRGISIPGYRARATPVRLIVRCLLQGLLTGSSVCRGMTAAQPSLSPGGGGGGGCTFPSHTPSAFLPVECRILAPPLDRAVKLGFKNLGFRFLETFKYIKSPM